jgi:NAD+ synthase (glutamine-hydrolysing)
MYNVNCSIPKTLIKKLIGYYSQNCCTDNQEISEVLHDILSTPVSPELTGSGAEGEKAQVTEDKIGPYELHDFFLYNLVRHNFSSDKILFLAEHANFEKQYGTEVIKKWYNIFIKIKRKRRKL